MSILIAKNVEVTYNDREVNLSFGNNTVTIPTKIGDKITVYKKYYKKYKDIRSNYIEWESHCIEPIECVFLGYSYVYNGYINPRKYDNESSYSYPPSFTQKESVKVAVVQPYSKSNRYRKSFYAEL